jgi:predicted NUDIX family NTP pyrophosphohydrolase
MEQMVNESNLSGAVRDQVHAEANKILDMIEEFGSQVGQPSASASSLARDLVTIRRRSNRMALDVYLNTFDMRWPQNSLQLGVIVERVQQACLDRATIQLLETQPNPLETLKN